MHQCEHQQETARTEDIRAAWVRNAVSTIIQVHTVPRGHQTFLCCPASTALMQHHYGEAIYPGSTGYVPAHQV